MIKKLFSLIILLLLAVMIGVQETNATTIGEATWSGYNAYSTYYYAIATIEVPYNTGTVQFQVPYSDYHELTYGGLDGYIKYFTQDDLSTPVLTEILSDVRPTGVAGIYSMDLIQKDLIGIAKIEIWIPQNYSTTPADYVTEGGFLDQRDFLLFIPIAPYDIPVFWNNVNIYSTYYAIETEIEVPFNASSLQLYLPESAYHRFEYGAVDSVVQFFDETDALLETVDLIDIADKPEGLMLIDFTSYELNEVASIKIRVMQTYSSMPSGYTDYMNEFTSITFNVDVKLAIYIVDNEEYDRQLFTSKPPELTVSKAGYTFDGWFFKTGVKYDFASTISDSYIEFNSTVMLYARFTRTDTIPIFEEGTPANAFNNFLAIFHLNNLWGYLLTYLISNIIVIIGFNKLQLSSAIISLGMLFVTALFIFVGVLPLLMIIIGLGIDIVVFIYGVTRGE